MSDEISSSYTNGPPLSWDAKAKKFLVETAASLQPELVTAPFQTITTRILEEKQRIRIRESSDL
jgi:hypothetical protein